MVEAVTLENIEHLAIGSAFLGTGGGGDPYLGSLLCREALAEYGPVELADPAELTHSDSVFVAAAMGAPTVMLEKLFSLEDQDRAVRSLEQRLGCQASTNFPHLATLTTRTCCRPGRRQHLHHRWW